jgi:hypothetical protein
MHGEREWKVVCHIDKKNKKTHNIMRCNVMATLQQLNNKGKLDVALKF